MRTRAFVGVLSVEARKLMSYRLDFWLATVAAFVVELFLAWTIWKAVFLATGQDQIGGFSLSGMVTYYTLVILLSRLVRGQDRGPDAATDIYQGSLNRYLMYPASYFTFKYAEHLGALGPACFQAILLGGVFAACYGSGEIHLQWTALLGVGFLLLANLLWFVLLFPLNCIAFWADNVWSLRVTARFFASLLGGLLLPLSVFPDSVGAALHWTPFPYLYSYPAYLLLGRELAVPVWQAISVLLVWVTLLGFLSRWIWRRGVRTYSGVGI